MLVKVRIDAHLSDPHASPQLPAGWQSEVTSENGIGVFKVYEVDAADAEEARWIANGLGMAELEPISSSVGCVRAAEIGNPIFEDAGYVVQIHAVFEVVRFHPDHPYHGGSASDQPVLEDFSDVSVELLNKDCGWERQRAIVRGSRTTSIPSTDAENSDDAMLLARLDVIDSVRIPGWSTLEHDISSVLVEEPFKGRRP